MNLSKQTQLFIFLFFPSVFRALPFQSLQGGIQKLSCLIAGKQPGFHILLSYQNRHPVVDSKHTPLGFSGQNREFISLLRRMIDSCQIQNPIPIIKSVSDFFRFVSLPFIEASGRNQTAAVCEILTEETLLSHRL